jgi:hypothetical protein
VIVAFVDIDGIVDHHYLSMGHDSNGRFHNIVTIFFQYFYIFFNLKLWEHSH